ncbi:MAG: DUF4167 domain-containing protein [Alphaproteobacteria bacterium]|nr:DUF4167 domain-containing protein [Alphaproteobacteria bacterium]
MKKNTKFRSNNNINLNYRFDSISPAGKYCGTALDLIKRYNDLAKEAGTAGNYVEMEVFRQYAEHYRKIVTEINERKNFVSNQKSKEQDTAAQQAEDVDNQSTEDTSPMNDNAPAQPQEEVPVLRTKPLSLKKRTLKIVEVTTAEPIETDEHASTQKSKQSHKRPLKKEIPVEQADVSEA